MVRTTVVVPTLSDSASIAQDLWMTHQLISGNLLCPHGRLGIILRKLGRDTEAEAQFRRCVEISPTDYFSKWYLSGVPGDPPLG
jgi:hypothetical protein